MNTFPAGGNEYPKGGNERIECALLVGMRFVRVIRILRLLKIWTILNISLKCIVWGENFWKGIEIFFDLRNAIQL